MKQKLTPIFTGTTKVVAPLHLYNNNVNNKQDVIIVVSTPYDVIRYIVVDNINEEVVYDEPLMCLDTIKNNIIKNFTNITNNDIYIQSVFGLSNLSNSTPYTSLFIMLKNKVNVNRYLVQINITNHDTTNLDIQYIETHIGVQNIYMDVLVQHNVLISDFKSNDDIDVYITYINIEDNDGNLAAANIEGLRLLVTDNEKQEFMDSCSIVLPSTIYPIVDIWTQDHHALFKLTDDTNKVQFNFSTGVGFLGFDE